MSEGIKYAVLYCGRSVIFYPVGALWFIQACIVAVWIIYFFYKFDIQKLILPISIILYVFAMICNSYYFLVSDTVIGNLIDNFLLITASARNGIFVGVFYIYLGFLINKADEYVKKNNFNKIYLAILLVISYCIYILEVILLNGKESKDDGSLFIILPLFSFLLVLFCVQFKSISLKSIVLRNLSTGIYLLHSPLLNLIIGIGILVFNQNDVNNVFKLVSTLVLAIIICLISYKSKNKFFNSILK